MRRRLILLGDSLLHREGKDIKCIPREQLLGMGELLLRWVHAEYLDKCEGDSQVVFDITGWKIMIDDGFPQQVRDESG